MKIETNVLNTGDIQTTSRTKKMTIDSSASAMLFKMVTGDLYSDPIGSVIREIASNCFDSHVEAGTDSTKNPVIVKLTNNSGKEGTSYISFIDKGVGMNPDRVINIFGNYFKSTKRSTNNLIGGFGLGGKTPLAYTESFFIQTVADKQDDIDFCKSEIDLLNAELAELEEGTDEYNIVQSEIGEMEQRLLTVANLNQPRVEYLYNIFLGAEAPEHQLMNMKGTDAVKGTEVRIPLEDNDIPTFERKTVQQLFYFENIIFDGFSDSYGVTNDYNLVKGKNFIYRGDSYSSKMHICLGKVAYPIDYRALELNEYNWEIPVAIRLEIGELEGTGVVPSREAINYSKGNIKIIKEKMDAALAEMIEMLGNQYDNVRTAMDYYKSMDNFGHLYFDDENSVYLGGHVHKSDVALPNFKYDAMRMPHYSELLKLFYAVKRYGKKEKRYHRGYGESLDSMPRHSNTYFVPKEFNRKLIKQSYLQWKHEQFYLHTPLDLNDDVVMDSLCTSLGLTEQVKKDNPNYDPNDPYSSSTMYTTKYVGSKKKAQSLVKDLFKEVKEYVEANSENYDDVEPTQEFIDFRAAKRKEKLSAEVLKATFPVKSFKGSWGGDRFRPTLEQLNNLKGRIYYGFKDDENALRHGVNVASEFKSKICDTWRFGTRKESTQGMLFLQISKQNERYMKMLGKKAIHIDYFYQTYVVRKLDKIVSNKMVHNVRTQFNELHDWLGLDFMKDADQEIYDMYHNVHANLPEKGNEYWKYDREKIKRVFGIDVDTVVIEFKYQDDLDKLAKITKDSRDKFDLLSSPYRYDSESEIGKHFVGLLGLCIVK